jgi:hypothetical protein
MIRGRMAIGTGRAAPIVAISNYPESGGDH